MSWPTTSVATRAGAALLGVIILAGLIAACGGNSAADKAHLRAARKEARKRAHPTFSVAPCSLLSARQVSAVLGVKVHTSHGRAGCIYMGTTHPSSHTRTLTVTPGARPASAALISTSIKHPVTVTGSGYRAQVGSPMVPGDVRVPASAAAGVLAGQTYVALLVQDDYYRAPSQVPRATTLAREVGRELAQKTG